MVKHKQSVANLPTNCLNVFDHFVGLKIKGLILWEKNLLHCFMVILTISQEIMKLQGFE